VGRSSITQSPHEYEADARERTDELVRLVKDAGGTVTQTHLRVDSQGSGTEAQHITGVAEELGADLIVVGSRGLGGLKRALMGSVSESVVRHAHCPVLVVRR
jgi:nucleotide-binding universal stress UspA family protein